MVWVRDTRNKNWHHSVTVLHTLLALRYETAIHNGKPPHRIVPHVVQSQWILCVYYMFTTRVLIVCVATRANLTLQNSCSTCQYCSSNGAAANNQGSTLKSDHVDTFQDIVKDLGPDGQSVTEKTSKEVKRYVPPTFKFQCMYENTIAAAHKDNGKVIPDTKRLGLLQSWWGQNPT